MKTATLFFTLYVFTLVFVDRERNIYFPPHFGESTNIVIVLRSSPDFTAAEVAKLEPFLHSAILPG